MVFLLTSMAMATVETLSQLKAHADTAHGGDQAKLCLEYARRMMEDADSLYTKGDVDKAESEIGEVVEYAHKAAYAASASGKHVKETEIDLRKLGKRMHDIAATLSVDDRPPVKQAVDEIDEIRTDLLVRMFGPQAEPKEKP
jgi:hypothetical protein